jgi:hypothetical protein
VIEFALEKKETGPFWERLLKEKTKYHWLKTDFNKWKDEDESDVELVGGGGGGGGGGGQDLEEVCWLSYFIFQLFFYCFFSASFCIYFLTSFSRFY